MPGDLSPSIDVVERVAEVHGTDPASLPVLYESIDPDALDQLLSTSDVRIQFEYAGYYVSVETDDHGSIHVDLDGRPEISK